MNPNKKGTNGSVFRLSVPLKVIALAGVVYLITWLMGLAMQRVAGIDFSLSVMGVEIGHLYLFLQVILFSMAAVFGSHVYFEKPLEKLIEAMKKAEEGDFLTRLPVFSSDEFGEFNSGFNRMLSKLTDMYAKKLQTEQDIKMAAIGASSSRRLEEKSKVMEQMNKQLENTVRDLSMIYEIGQEVASIVDLDTLYHNITETLKKFLRITQFAIMIYDEAAEELYVKSSYGFKGSDIMLRRSFKKGEGLFGIAVEAKRNLYSKDSRNDSRFFSFDSGRFEVSTSFLSIPLLYKGEALGVINFGREGIDSFSDSDIKMLELVAAQTALALANASLYTKTRELSVKDELTGVYNRRHFHHMLQIEWKRAVRFQRDLSGVMIDIDHFKNYNDTFGHTKGDEVLRQIGEILSRNLREVDTVSRFGGEEFFLLLPDTDKHGAIAVAEKVRKLVEEKRFAFDSDIGSRVVTVCAGVASYSDDVEQMDDLIDHADIALYRAKEEGRNRVISYARGEKDNRTLERKLREDEITVTERDPFLSFGS